MTTCMFVWQILHQLDMTDFTVQNVLLATILPPGGFQVPRLCSAALALIRSIAAALGFLWPLCLLHH